MKTTFQKWFYKQNTNFDHWSHCQKSHANESESESAYGFIKTPTLNENKSILNEYLFSCVIIQYDYGKW
jgi:hypothetical protein